jgi:hypothetical protein
MTQKEVRIAVQKLILAGVLSFDDSLRLKKP